MTNSKKTGRIPKSKLLSYVVNAGLLLVFYFLFFALIANGTINRYSSGIMTTMFINIILTVSLNLVSGFLGQLVLGHAGFMSVGAYTAALFTLYSGLPITISFPISIVLAGVMAAVFGVIIGVPALRLRGDYLAIITLGFGEIIRVIILACDFTGGAKGLRGIPTILPKGSDATSLALAKYSYVFWLAVITVVVIWAFVRSRHGEIFRKEMAYIQTLYDRLSRIPQIVLYTPRPEPQHFVPVLSCNVKNVPSEEVGAQLARYGIAVRCGLHCAPAAHGAMGTLEQGTIRMASSVFSNIAEINTVYQGFLKIIHRNFAN